MSHTQPSPPAGPPAYDPWNSPLWANPDTVAGTWAPQAASQPTFEAFYDESPVAKKSRVLPIVAGVMAAALVGVGARPCHRRRVCTRGRRVTKVARDIPSHESLRKPLRRRHFRAEAAA